MKGLVATIWHRTILSLKTRPKWSDSRFAGWLTLGFGLLTLALGLQTGLLQRKDSDPSFIDLLRSALVIVVVPCFFEELVFRVWLLPHPSEKATKNAIWWVVGGVLLFTLWHPFNAWLFMPQARETFYDVRFLGIVILLGLACSIAYRRTGSIFAPIAIHWVAVFGWKVFFGGPQFSGS